MTPTAQPSELFQPDLTTADEWMELGIRAFLRMCNEDNPALTSEMARMQMGSFVDILRPHIRQGVRDLFTTHVAVLRTAYEEMKADKTEIAEVVQ